jgi:hypothetical protein
MTMSDKVYRPLPDHSPVLGLTESGSSCMITIGQVGYVVYDRKDAEDLAKLLDSAAAMVREHA